MVVLRDNDIKNANQSLMPILRGIAMRNPRQPRMGILRDNDIK
jgi:hypothetical protein